VLSAQNLGKRFGPRWLFRGLQIDLEPGQCLGIQGPNGSGKSTLLKILLGLQPPSEGTLQRPPGRNQVGYYSIEGALYANLTVQEHLELGADLRGLKSDLGLLQTVDLQDAAHKYVWQISTGMKTRLKLALAIQPQPELLILDEPSASLDDDGRNLVRLLIQNQKQRGAVLLASNDPEERRLATHVLRVVD
jgi:ABC-type multidrug transport system ATPase subunit